MYGGELQDRIRTDNLKNASRIEEDDPLAIIQQQKSGRLLNEAIIKYRIEKKDIVDTANRTKFD